jgi:hypothetical protein
MIEGLDRQVQTLMKYIYILEPDVQVKRQDILYEDEHANLKVYPPLSWDEDRCLELQHKIAERASDMHQETGYLILVFVYTPEEQIFQAQQELEQARKKQHNAQKILAEAERLGLYRASGAE